jgi:hypothetical protein
MRRISPAESAVTLWATTVGTPALAIVPDLLSAIVAAAKESLLGDVDDQYLQSHCVFNSVANPRGCEDDDLVVRQAFRRFQKHR